MLTSLARHSCAFLRGQRVYTISPNSNHTHIHLCSHVRPRAVVQHPRGQRVYAISPNSRFCLRTIYHTACAFRGADVKKTQKRHFAARLNRCAKQLPKAGAKTKRQTRSRGPSSVTSLMGCKAKAARNFRLVIFGVQNLGALLACQCFGVT